MTNIKIDRAVIEINGGCNYSCKMCPQAKETGGRDKRFLKKMSLTEFRHNIEDCLQYGLRVVNLEGSGEPTLNRNLPEYIKIVKEYGLKAFIFSNGFNMKDSLMKESVDAGLDYFRFSIIGFNPEEYRKWMNNHIDGRLTQVLWNVLDMKKYISEVNSKCVIATYHLITDNEMINQQKNMYRELSEEFLGVNTEIWKLHNWSGVYDPEYTRNGTKRTCGRPFSPDVVIRAGGLHNKRGAVAPCCQVLGRDEEAVLGHTSENTIEEIIRGKEYSKLREGHRTGNWPDYCKDCDFLIDDPNVLVYTNYDRSLYKMHGTEFDLNEYR